MARGCAYGQAARLAPRQIALLEHLHLEAALDQNVERLLTLKEQSGVFEKLALCVCSIRSLGRFARELVLAKWEIPHYEANFIAIRLQNLFDYGMHRGARGTLKVSELNNRYRCVCFAA